MESILAVFKIIKKDVWMASVYLKDAFFTIPINKSYQKYFMFEGLEKIYKFIAMPNGFSDAMRVFTKVSRPVYAYLKQQGYMLVRLAGKVVRKPRLSHKLFRTESYFLSS